MSYKYNSSIVNYLMLADIYVRLLLVIPDFLPFYLKILKKHQLNTPIEKKYRIK